MKKYIVARILVVIMMITGISCKKSFLEVLPKGKVIAVSYRDYDLLLNNTNLQNVGTDAQLLMGDEVVTAEPYFSSLTLREQRLFAWADKIYEPNEDSPETAGPLSSIYTYNKIINEVMAAPDGTLQQKKMILAEALAGRAWTYFLLINYYGKPYLKTTAASDAGFPVITTADITVNSFKRASVQEVYDLIVSDLQKAMPDLSLQVYHRLRMSRPSAQSLLGKVYVWMQRFEEASPLFESALLGFTTAQTPVQLYDYNKTFATGGAFLPISTFGPNYPTTNNNQEVAYLRQFSNFHVTGNTLQVKKEVMDLYQTSDLRLKLYSSTPFPSGDVFQAGAQRRTAPSIVPFGVNVPETFLLLAECKTRLNDRATAVNLLEQFRKNRLPAANASVPTSVANNQQLLLRFIMEERLREFAGLGFRWFDIRRLSVDPLFNNETYSHTLYGKSGTTTTFQLKPARLTLKLPPKILQANPDLQDNP